MPRFAKLIILDLNGTLVYPAEASLDRPADFLVTRHHVYKRPHVDTFLARCLEWFDVAVWTSSGAGYADGVVRALFGDPARLAFLWTRERCTIRDVFMKDFSKLSRPLEQVIAVDDTPAKFAGNDDNLVAVRSFKGGPDDAELPRLLPYLERLGPVENVRAVDKRGWRNE